MPYSILEAVEFWGQFTSNSFASEPDTWNYETRIQHLIDTADGEIDAYLHVPRGFFADGGVAVQDELHDGKALPSGSKRPLVPKYVPIIEVIKLEYYSSGAWATKTEGATSDYQVLADCIILLNPPDTTAYRNIRLNYKAGYSLTPRVVAEVSARLAGAIGQLIIDSRNRSSASVPGGEFKPADLHRLSENCFTRSLQRKLDPYRYDMVKVHRG